MGTSSVSRRHLLGWAGAAGAAGAAAGFVGGRVTGDDPTPVSTSSRLAAVDHPVTGSRYPQGLADYVPSFGHLIAVDLLPGVRRDPATARRAATELLAGVGALADAADRGEDLGASGAAALDVRPAQLQITPALGASLLRACGLDDQRPEAFLDLPHYANDRLDPGLCDGDLYLQVAAEDPMRLAGAVEALSRQLSDRATVRWARQGFRTTQAGNDSPKLTGRNLMGHRDGTANPPLGSPLWEFTTLVSDPGSWMDGGSYVVIRQVRIDLDGWFGNSESDRDRVIGRKTPDGAPLGGLKESDKVDLDLRSTDGGLVIPERSHIRLANPRNTGGSRIYRRGWNYDDGWAADGSRDAGLLFVAWQSDLRRGFLPIQESLVERADALNDYTTHVGSAVFAAPGRSAEESYAGQRLMEG